MARRALDYLVGFNISPILWTKLPGSKSAGRVQSVALKLLTEREHEIEIFKPVEFWTLNINFTTKDKSKINSTILQLDGDKIEIYLNETGSTALIKDPSDFDSIYVVMQMKG